MGRGIIMKNLSISKKLIVGFGIVLLLMLLSAGLSAFSINSIDTQVQLYAKYTVPSTQYMDNMRLDMERIMKEILHAIVVDDMESVNEALDNVTAYGADFAANLDLFANNQRDDNQNAGIEKMRESQANAVSARTEIAKLVSNPTAENKDRALTIYFDQYQPALSGITSVLDEFADLARSNAQQQSATAASVTSLAWILMISSMAASLLLTVIVINIIRKSILRPVKEIVAVYDEMSKGNMGVEINYDSRDEMGSMVKSIRKTNTLLTSYIRDIKEKLDQMSHGDMRVNMDMEYVGDFAAIKKAIQHTALGLSQTLQTINTAAEQVSTGAAQVSSGAQALAAGSTEQASSVEELSVSITRIAEEATANSANVKTATQYVEQAHTHVRDSSEHMKQLNEAMANIGSASSQITNITKVIEDIAFQTNILALNAAIEAARVGNAGKGFAVVADEVRNLAAKSAEAAKQTGDLIQASVATVNEGTQISTQTAQILHVVEEKTTQVNEVINKINQASADQAAAIEQIKVGLNQVSSVVQTNAATAEENSATSEEMSAQAATLREEVRKFQLESGYENEHLTAISLSRVPEANTVAYSAVSGIGKY